MNENPLTPFQEDIERVQLEESARQRIRTYLEAFVERHPLRNRRFLASFSFARVALASIALLALVTGGATVAAADALPGDTLYPVKVYVAEEIRRIATVSPDASARYEIERVERRLHEAEVLAELDIFDEHKQHTVTHHFERHLDRARQGIERAEVQNRGVARGLTLELETTLRVHEAVLMSIFEDRDEHKGQGVLQVLETVHDRTERISQERIEKTEQLHEDDQAVEDVTLEEAATHRLAQVEQLLSELEEISASDVQRWSFVRDSIQQAADYMDEAASLNEDGLYRDSLIVIDEAMRLAREARQFLRVRDAVNSQVQMRRTQPPAHSDTERSERVPEHVPPFDEDDGTDTEDVQVPALPDVVEGALPADAQTGNGVETSSTTSRLGL